MKISEIEKRKWDEKSAKILAENRDWSFSGSYENTFSSENTLKPVSAFFNDLGGNAQVLDCGCGTGWTTLLLSTRAGQVNSFDISKGQIRVLQRYIEENEIQNVYPSVAEGCSIPYKDAIFDFVFGNAILHHLPLDDCLPEIVRVLKPGGKAAFCEPFGENPLINLFRYIKHHFAEKYLGADRPLKYSDLDTFKHFFHQVEFVESSFTGYRLYSLVRLDNFLKKFPILKRYVSYITILMEK